MEARKRSAMTPLLYLEVILWGLLLAFTIFGTWVISDNSIAETCWQVNPCADLGESTKGLPNLGACKLDNGTSAPNSTPVCAQVFADLNAYSDCFNDWFGYAASYYVNPGPWNASDCVVGDINAVGDSGTNSSSNSSSDSTSSSDSDNNNPINPIPPNMTVVIESFILDAFGVPYDPHDIVGSAPWFFCFNASCQSLLRQGDACNQWNILESLKVTSQSRKAVFEGLIYSSWGMLAITGLIVYLTFNSFPDYSDLDSWERTLKGIASTCCCGSQLEAAAGNGDPASREIAKSLHMLFGGIDLDPSDRLLGMFLVSEQQSWRRQRHALHALEAAGIVKTKGKPGVMRRAWRRLVATVRRPSQQSQAATAASSTSGSPGRAAASRRRRPASYSAPQYVSTLAVSASGESAASLAAPSTAAGSYSGPSPEAALRLNSEAALPPWATSPSLGPGMPLASPFDMDSNSGSLPPPDNGPSFSQQQQAQHAERGRALGPSPASSGALRPTRSRSLLPMYRHTMLRLRSGAFSSAASDAVSHWEQQQQQDGRLAGLEEAEGDRDTATTPTLQADSLTPPPSSPGGHQSLDGQQGVVRQDVKIKLTQRYLPMLTPSGCARELPVTPQEAAAIYTGYHDPVPPSVMKEARRISKFAVGAYGLQSIVWGKGKRPAMCMGNVNMLLKCLGRPLRLENKFRKRNFNAILDVTGKAGAWCGPPGVQPEDLLYVSYANSPGGVLPYIIMLDRPTKSVVLAVRGTVSMEDLITDLLSSPLDVSSWLPDWVNEANADGKGMYAHSGIVGSATAILKDLEERGLLKELLLSKLARSSPDSRPGSQEQNGSGTVGSEWGGDATAAARATLRSKMTFWQQRTASMGAAPSEKVAEPAPQAEAEALDEAGAESQVPNLSQMGANAEVRLSLQRAQTLMSVKLQREGWQLVVTGHSLGAAVACMLAFHLKDLFPDLHCWAFNPPGGLLSWNLSRLAQRFCTSIVVGKDVISRLSFATSKRLVDEMVTCLARCKRPKLLVLADLLLKRRASADSSPATFCDYEHISDEAVRALEGYHKTSLLHAGEQVDMFPPGRLVFLRPFKGAKAKQTVWDAVWVDAPALMGEGILVSPSMMSHHRVFILADALRSAMAGEAEHAQQGVPEEDQVVLDRVV
ncbi:hypothetical protein N2152v2_006163 [Parachlorella kessleri]